MPDTPITYEQAIDLIHAAAIVTIKTPTASYIVDDFKEHGGPNRRTCLTAPNCIAAVTLHDKGDEQIGVRNGHRLHIAGEGELRLYTQYNP